MVRDPLLFLSEICLLTNARRVASVRAETYSNLFSLAVEHFNSVLDQYPVMRRTMESIAAERLNKIGKNPSLVSQREDLQIDLEAVNEILTLSTAYAALHSSEDHSAPNGTPDYDGAQGLFGKKALPRPKSESCFRLMSDLVALPALAGSGLVTTGSGAFSKQLSVNPVGAGPSTSGTSGAGGASTHDSKPDLQIPLSQAPSTSNGANYNTSHLSTNEQIPVKESKSSFNLHNLLR